MKFVGANIHRELTLGVWVDYCENILCALCVWRADLPLNIADIEDPLSVQGNGNLELVHNDSHKFPSSSFHLTYENACFNILL